MTSTSSNLPPYAFPAVRRAWLSQHEEPVIDPELAIVDAHHHLWDDHRGRYLTEDYLADTGDGHRVLASVFVQCHAMYRQRAPAAMASLGETEFANGVAAMSASGSYGRARINAAIVGFVDLSLGAAALPVLKAHQAAAGERFKGVRNIAVWDASPEVRCTSASPPPGLLSDSGFRQGFRLLADLGLSFDAWLYHTQLPELADLALAFPDVPIIIDHLGGPIGVGPYALRRAAVFDDWRRGMDALAACANVSLKLGGMAIEMMGFELCHRESPASSEDLATLWAPYVQAGIEAFGPRRCMFESNFPVDKAAYSYRTLWNAFKRLTRHLPVDDREALFSGVAQRVYRLPADALSPPVVHTP